MSKNSTLFGQSRGTVLVGEVPVSVPSDVLSKLIVDGFSTVHPITADSLVERGANISDLVDQGVTPSDFSNKEYRTQARLYNLGLK